MKIDMAKETFNRKISLLTSKLSIELRKVLYLEHSVVWLRHLETNKIRADQDRQALKMMHMASKSFS